MYGGALNWNYLFEAALLGQVLFESRKAFIPAGRKMRDGIFLAQSFAPPSNPVNKKGGQARKAVFHRIPGFILRAFGTHHMAYTGY